MSGLLKLLDLLASLLGRWLSEQQGKEIQNAYDQNHANPQERFAARFGPAADSLPDSDSQQLPAAKAKSGMDSGH
jgi:hypothetical protein